LIPNTTKKERKIPILGKIQTKAGLWLRIKEMQLNTSADTSLNARQRRTPMMNVFRTTKGI
jgi:hypothetical protein